MKKILSLFVFALGCLTLASCGDENYTEKVNSVTFSTESSTIPSVGGSVVFTVTGEGLTATSAADWLSVSLSGQTITATAAANPTRESRATHITVKASNGDTQLLSVIQSGFVIGIETYNLDVTDDAGNYALEYKSDDAVTVRSLAEWITASIDAEKNTVNVSVASNDDKEERVGMVEFTCGNVVDTFYVNQAGLLLEIENQAVTLNSNDAASLKIAVQHSKEVKVASDSEWLSASFNTKENAIVLEVAENAGSGRVGTVTVTSGNVVEKVNVTQLDFTKEVYGYYYFVYYDSSAKQYAYMPALLAEKSLTLLYPVNETVTIPFEIPLTVDAENGVVSFGPCSSFVGMYGSKYYIYLAWYSLDGYWSSYNNSKDVATGSLLVEKEDGENITYMELGGSFSNGKYDIDGWILRAMKAEGFSSANNAGNFDNLLVPYMEKIPDVTDEAGAKAACRRAVKLRGHLANPAAPKRSLAVK